MTYAGLGGVLRRGDYPGLGRKEDGNQAGFPGERQVKTDS